MGWLYNSVYSPMSLGRQTVLALQGPDKWGSTVSRGIKGGHRYIWFDDHDTELHSLACNYAICD